MLETEGMTEAQIGERAQQYLAHFAGFTSYLHGEANPHLQWLETMESIPREAAIDFLSAWYSFSRRTPQILLACASAWPDVEDRACMMANYLEEDGLLKRGDAPHYVLLEQLIEKLGGTLILSDEAERLITTFMAQLPQFLTPAGAWGVATAFEHPALDITAILRAVTRLAGFAPLLETDPYLVIHVAVEPSHIVWAHGTALRYIQRGHGEEVIAAFRHVMQFWSAFWTASFTMIGYSADDATITHTPWGMVRATA
jgi:hypothetical protein